MLQNKTLTKILSLIVAISLWGYVVWTENPTISQAITNIPVEIRNLTSLEERGLVLLGNQEYTVDLKIQGKKKDIGNISANDITASIDVGGYAEGEVTLTVNVQTLDNAQVVEVKPNRITVNIDRIVDSQSNIRVGMTGALPAGTEVGDPVPELESVTLRGANSLINTVSYVSANIDISKLTEEEVPQSVKLVPTNTRGEEVYGVTAIPGSMEITSRLYYTKEVPLSVSVIGQVPDGYDIEHITVPDEITVRGNQEAVSAIRGVNGTVDVSGFTESGRVTVTLALPQGITLSKENSAVNATVTVVNLNAPDVPDTPQGDGGSHGETGGNVSAE